MGKTKKPKCQKFQIFYSLLFSFVLKLLLIQNPSRTLKTSMLTKQFLLNQISPPKKNKKVAKKLGAGKAGNKKAKKAKKAAPKKTKKTKKPPLKKPPKKKKKKKK